MVVVGDELRRVIVLPHVHSADLVPLRALERRERPDAVRAAWLPVDDEVAVGGLFLARSWERWRPRRTGESHHPPASRTARPTATAGRRPASWITSHASTAPTNSSANAGTHRVIRFCSTRALASLVALDQALLGLCRPTQRYRRRRPVRLVATWSPETAPASFPAKPPAPADAPDPLRWGRPEQVSELFAALGCTADIRHKAVCFRYPSWPESRRSLEAHGLCVIARQTLPAVAYEEMFEQVRALTEKHNRGESTELVWDAAHLEVLVTKP